MATLNANYVLGPFHQLLARCQHNVLLALRLIEKIDSFPAPTPEELAFMQLSFSVQKIDVGASKKVFKEWVLKNGFEDVHTCLRTTLERLFIYKSAQLQLEAKPDLNIESVEKEMR